MLSCSWTVLNSPSFAWHWNVGSATVKGFGNGTLGVIAVDTSSIAVTDTGTDIGSDADAETELETIVTEIDTATELDTSQWHNKCNKHAVKENR